MLLNLAEQGVDALERLGAPPFLSGEGVMQPAVLLFQPGRFHAAGGKLGAQMRVLRPQTVQAGEEFGDARLELFQKFHAPTLAPGATSCKALLGRAHFPWAGPGRTGRGLAFPRGNPI